MAKRKSSKFLPQVFQTSSNNRFLNATLDQLIQEPALKKVYGYIGQQDQSSVFNSKDYYITENDPYAQFYQLEPGVVIKKRAVNSNTYKIDNVYNYPDLLNQVVSDGGINNNHQRMFTNRYYNYNGFVDLDKLTNYRQYYWVPNGPLSVDVTAGGTAIQNDYYVTRVSYTANNQTEQQSAAIGRSGYTIEGYSNAVNPTLTLVRGGHYNFHLGQLGFPFWIQTEIGTSGTSSIQNNISTRDVLGVVNNGNDFGTVTFNVPQKTAQDQLINLPAIQNIDMIVDVPYNQIQGVNYDTFIQTNGFDGVRAFDGKYIYINVPFDDTWDGVALAQRSGIWQVNVQPDRTMKLTFITTWPNNYKTFVTQGQQYGHTFCYKNSSGYFQQFPTISALLDTLYYVDQNNPNIYGQIRLIDPDPKSVLNVNDIIGRDHYTSPNGVQFTSGLKVKFIGLVTPGGYYGNEYIVEGVGNAIRLVKFADLVTPETINAASGGFFGNGEGYDAGGYDGNTNNPTQKDYITINRSSIDGNSWSRNNRWFHRDVLQYAANVTNQTFEFDANYQAKRPIVEFLPDFKLYSHGTSYAGPVTVVDSTITNAFAQVEGFNNYALQNNGVFITDGIQLQNGFTVLFKNDANPTVRNTIYQVQTVKTRATAVYNVITYAYSSDGTSQLYINDTTNLRIGQAVAGIVLNNSYIYGSNPYNNSTVYNTGDYVTFKNNTYRATAIQGSIATTATFTASSNNITVASATGITIGQPINVLDTYVPFGTVVTNVSGTTVTLSNNASSSGSAVNVAFTIVDTSVVPTTATLTNNSNTITVASTFGIVTGQAVFETNIPTGNSSRIPVGTIVKNINTDTNTITLSNAVTGDGTGVTVSFNTFGISPPNNTRWSLISDSNPFYPNTTITKIDSSNNIVYISSKLKNVIPSGTYIQFNNTADQINLIPYKTVQNGEAIVALDGINNQGNMFYYVDGVWNTAQIRNSRPQFPLFDIVDSNGFLLGDTASYPSSNFKGSQLFGYTIGNGARDSELGFSLKYQSIGNLGDIVFSNYYVSDTFNYNLNQIDTVVNINSGYAPFIVGWNNYTFANGWTEVSDKSKQHITKTFTATAVSFNNFDLNVVYNNSYYERNLFVSINGVLQSSGTYNITTNATTTILNLSNNLNEGDRLFVKINGISSVYKQLYTMPRNLTNNSENTEFATITLGQVRNHLIEIGNNSLDLIGPPAGSNNFRDIKYNNVGGKLLQHSASMRPAALLFSNPDVDPVRAINFASQSYQNFKNQLLDAINTKQFGNTGDYRACLDTILADFNLTANSANNFYYSDMIAGGNNYVKNTYTIQDTTYRNFNLTTNFSTKPTSYIAALVYLNGVLLVNGFDYTITNFTVSLSSSLTIARLDTLDVYEYSSTLGCNVPPTPSKLGLYPKFKPQITVDNTYASGPQTVVVGHDGSYNVAYGDYRDNILLEYEKRVYNNIAVEYQNNSDYDLISVQPGAFRKTDYSFAEWTQLLSSSFLTWSTQNNVDIFTNSTTSNNLFSFNYSSGTDKIFGDTVPGYWRGIYNYFYDTDRPHTAPWEMIGFTSEPVWWQNKYGPGPYSNQNTTMWSDLELGLVYNGAPNKSYINYRYSRPGLSRIIPTDEHGNLLPPNLTVLRSFDANAAAGAWRVGDQSPAETTWRRSSAYPFATQVAWCLARPAEYCALKYNTHDVVYNSNLNQIINTVSNNRVFNYAVTGADQYIPGLNVFIRELLISNNLDTQRNWIDVANNSTFNLVYKLSGYTDKSYITVVADQVSPQSTNTSVLIPQENYQIKVTKSAPVARAVYSAVVVQKTNTGYQVSGFDKERPYFLAIPSVINSNNYGISAGNSTAIVYRDAQNSIISFAYGTIFATEQQVVDFLISYGRYLTNSGFVFDTTLADNATISDWSLAAKEFLFWNQQQWGDNTVISLTPAGTNITFSSPYGIVDTISNDHNLTKIINSDGAVLTGRDYRVYRSDNTFTVELKDTQKGIHLIDLIVVQYEHSIVFDNSTVFNDILYDEQVGSRQYRLRLDGTKTQGWNGSFYAPGFLINYSDIDIWYSYTDYYTGDIVLFKNKYYAAQNFIPGKPKFVATDWYEINGNLLSKQLIPNMASGAAQFTNFYNPDEADLNTSADIQSKHATGFQDRQYLTDLGLDRTTQYKFYLGMIAQKGTQAVVNAFLRNKQSRIDSDITLVEQWALKLGNYGGTSNVDKLEFNIGNSTAINNQYLFEFISKNDARNTTYNSVKPQDLLLAPNTYRTDLFAKTENINTLIPYAGPVSTNDVALTTYDISKIYNISNLNGVLGESSKIWIAADSSNQWGVYRLTQTSTAYVTNVNQTSPTELTFTTNVAHGFAVLDYVMLKGARLSNVGGSNISDLSGFYRVSRVGGNVFSVKVTNNTSVSSGVLKAQVFKLVNVRYSTVRDFGAYTPARGWSNGEIIYIDNGPSGYQVLQNTPNYPLYETKSPVFTTNTDNFGTSIKINKNQNVAIVGASSKNTTGEVFVYGKNQQNVWQEVASLSPDSRIRSFGSSVDINNNNIAAIAATGGNYGSIYIATANSQSIAVTQIIHYDNAVVQSAGFTQSNAYVLVPNATSLSNFAAGMGIGGGGIPSGTKIANIGTGPQFNYFGLTTNLAVASVTLAANSSIAIYSNLTPGSKFATSMSMSTDGNWLYVGEPVNNQVFVYQYANVAASSTTRVGDGSSKTFTYPATALGQGLRSQDIKVYVNGVIQVPELDYYRDPGNDNVAFYTAPASGAAINLVYEPYFRQVNRIITTDTQASGFGFSVNTNSDGRIVAIGAPNSTITNSNVTNSGLTYIYERTIENLVASGTVNNFQLSNAFANSAALTTPYLTAFPIASVDGIIDTAASFNYATNQVTLSSYPQIDTTVSVQTNQFALIANLKTDTVKVDSNYGETVRISANNSEVYVGAPGWNSGSRGNGSVWKHVNVAKKYGSVTGTVANFIVAANSSIRINDYLVTFGQTFRPPYDPIYFDSNVYQVASTINAAAIPGITAVSNNDGTITINSDAQVAHSNLHLRDEYGSVLETMGIAQWQLAQTIYAPLAQDTLRFGERLSLNPDSTSLVIGSTLSNNKITTTFDAALTRFDGRGVRFIDTIYRSGAAHLYEYVPSATESVNDSGTFVYGTILTHNTASSLERFASGVDISSNFIMVGAPTANILNNPTGAMYVYYNKNANPIWQTIRSQPQDFDSRLIERAYIYNSTTSKLIADLPIVDLQHGYLPNSSETYLDYIINYDPAVYSNVPSTVSFSYDRKNNWGSEHVGKLWWDTNSIKYYDNTQGSTLDRFNFWGLAFPASSVVVYEWVESDVVPKDYATTHPLTPPLYTVNDVYSTRVIVDPSTGYAVTKYYFWVRNSTNNNNNRPSALEIQNTIAFPRNSAAPFVAVMSTGAFALYNAQSLIANDTNIVIEYKNTIKPQLIHSEWTLFDDGTDLGIAVEFLNKLNDSLRGQDSTGRQVPDVKLPIAQRYGTAIRPRQSVFSDATTAKKLFIEQVNNFCTINPIKLVRKQTIEALNIAEAEPLSDSYVTRVQNTTELGYLDTNVYSIGDSVLVAQGISTLGGWGLYRLVNSTTNVRSWQVYRVQTYDVNAYWSYGDWYSSKFNANILPKYTLTSESDITKLSLLVGDIIYIINSTDGGWKWVLVNANGLELLAQQNATIQFSAKLYDINSSGFGWQTSSFENVAYAADSAIEFGYIFDIIKDKLMVSEYRSDYKTLVKLMIDTISTQHLQTDWLMKTSFVDIYHRVRGLDPLPVYLPQPETIVTSFFSEVKPFHTKLKQYVAKYDNSNAIEIAHTNTTDFDLQPYYSTTSGKYRSPQLNNVLDTTALTTQAVYQPWVANHLYGVERVDIVNGGAGYGGTTTVEILGDGNGATATPIIISGMISSVVVTNSGKNYTNASAVVHGLGTGAIIIPIIGNGLPRTFDTHIKFDRYTYSNSIADWAANTHYAVNTVVVYNHEPYKTVTDHTSGSTFDFTKFILLVVKVWYPQTQYALNDIVIYNKVSYIATVDFTSGAIFDSNNLASYSGAWLDNAADRVWAYYSPKSGMAGRDLAQVMLGMEYGGVGVKGPDFNQTPGYDVLNYDKIAYDLSTSDTANVIDVYGPQTEDTYIRSDFLDSGLGLRPQDINVDGGQFVDVYSSHAPEELIPGRIFDTLDIRVKTLPLGSNSMDIKVFTAPSNSGNFIDYAVATTGVSFPIGGIEKFVVLDKVKGPLADGVDYTVDWVQEYINLNYTVSPNTFFYVIMFGSNGINPITDTSFFADGVRTDFELDDNVLTDVQQAYVKVNGFAVSNWTLVNKLENGRNVLAVRFDTAPNNLDYIQIHLYALALGHRAYQELYEQTFFTSSSTVYPADYTFTLSNPEIYAEPISAYSIVKLNDNGLIPPQQTYFVGDGITTVYSMTNSYVKPISAITNGEITVIVNNITQTIGIDYTVYHDNTNTVPPVITFTVPPILNSKITISDSSNSDFKIYGGNTLILNQNLVIPNNSKITILTQGNHDAQDMYTKIFSGSTSDNTIIDTGFDSVGLDDLGFDNELNNLTSAIYFTLPHAVTNINQIYITYKAPGTSGGYQLLPYNDFVLTTPTRVQLDNNLNIAPTGVIVVRIFGSDTRHNAIEYRTFKDLNDNTRYYAVTPQHTTKLAADLAYDDDMIYVDNAALLQTPDPTTNTAGVVFIDGERITYGYIDIVNDALGNIRRGTAGTGVRDLYTAGTTVVDTSSSQEIPNSQDTFTVTPIDTYITNGYNTQILVPAGSTIKQGKLFTNIGESLQNSNTQQAIFIRSTT